MTYRPRKGEPTLWDIAERVGLSEASVSRCLRDHPRHSPETIAKVKAVAADIGYRRQ